MPSETRELMTAEELERFDLPGKSTELVRGRLIVREPPSVYHGHVAAKLLFLLGQHVYKHDLGWLFSQDTGFKIESNPDTVRAPDVAFVSKERQPAIPRRGYARQSWQRRFSRRTIAPEKSCRRSAIGSMRASTSCG